MFTKNGIGIELKADSIFDVFDSPRDYNALVIGQSGSGKSFLMGLLSVDYFKKGYDVIIFDSGYSHAKLAKILGRHIDFTLDNPISVNPFALIKNKSDLDEKLDSLKHFILGIANIDRDNKRYLLYSIYIEQSIIDLWNIHKDKLELSHFVDKFKNNDNFIDIFNVIKTFNEKYGDFFKSESEIDFNNAYTIIETSNLDNTPILRDAVISALYIYIFNKISVKDSKKTVCFMDEYQKYLNSYFMLTAIEPAFRRFRSHNASIIVSIQGFNDIFINNDKINRHGLTLLNNSAWKIFLKQFDESWSYINNYFKRSADLNRISMYSSILSSIPGEYFEAVIYSPFIKDDEPVFPSDIKICSKISANNKFIYYALSSSVSDNAEINKYLPDRVNLKNAAAIDIVSAINEVINQKDGKNVSK